MAPARDGGDGGVCRAWETATARRVAAARNAATTSHLAAELAAAVSFVTGPLIGKSLRERGLAAQRA